MSVGLAYDISGGTIAGLRQSRTFNTAVVLLIESCHALTYVVYKLSVESAYAAVLSGVIAVIAESITTGLALIVESIIPSFAFAVIEVTACVIFAF